MLNATKSFFHAHKPGAKPPEDPSIFETGIGDWLLDAAALALMLLSAPLGAQISDNVVKIGSGSVTLNGNSTYNGTWPVMPTTGPLPATSNGLYPSWYGECGQGVTAARAAATTGTRVYTVAYGSSTSGCDSDASKGTNPGITPCQALNCAS